jgi:hypothetical protein
MTSVAADGSLQVLFEQVRTADTLNHTHVVLKFPREGLV